MDTAKPLQDLEPAAVEPASPHWVAAGSRACWQINLALFLAGLATFSLLYCVQPLLPLLAGTFAVSPAQSALALSLSTGTLALAILAASAWSVHLDHRRLMFWSMILAASANLLASQLGSWPALLVARTLVGLCMGGVPAVAMAYLAEHIEPRGLGFSTGLYVGGTALGGMTGRVVVSWLVGVVSWRNALALLSMADLLLAIGFILLLPPATHPRQRQSEAADGAYGLTTHLAIWHGHLRQPRLRRLFCLPFLAMGAFVTIYNYAGFHLMAAPFHLSLGRIGLMFGAYVFGIAAAPAGGWLADRWGRPPVVVLGTGTALTGVLLTLSGDLGWVVTGVILLTVGFFMAHATASGWIGKLADGHKGHATALYLLSYYSGSSVLGAIGGWFWQWHGWPAVVAYAAALLLWMVWLAAGLAGGDADESAALVGAFASKGP